jgi:hypothetical protein
MLLLFAHPRPGFVAGLDMVVLSCNGTRLYFLTAMSASPA